MKTEDRFRETVQSAEGLRAFSTGMLTSLNISRSVSQDHMNVEIIRGIWYFEKRVGIMVTLYWALTSFRLLINATLKTSVFT